MHFHGLSVYIVYELLVGIATAAAQEADPEIRGKIQIAQVMTVFNWGTHPVVYFFPMLGIKTAKITQSPRKLTPNRLKLQIP